VLVLLAQYSHHPNYFQHVPGQPLDSFFEGPGSAANWFEIQRNTGCFFIPDWSSLGAKAAIQLEVCSASYRTALLFLDATLSFQMVHNNFMLTREIKVELPLSCSAGQPGRTMEIGWARTLMLRNNHYLGGELPFPIDSLYSRPSSSGQRASLT
jgi:hypothetical protein